MSRSSGRGASGVVAGLVAGSEVLDVLEPEALSRREERSGWRHPCSCSYRRMSRRNRFKKNVKSRPFFGIFSTIAGSMISCCHDAAVGGRGVALRALHVGGIDALEDQL